MNQILYVQGKKKNQPADIKKISLFFAVAMILLGVTLVGQGSYAIFSNGKASGNNNTVAENTKPQVEVTREEDDIVIAVTHDKAIQKIVYYWNEEQEETIEGNNRTSLSEVVPLPFGTNTLNVAVIDINGQETKYQKEYVVEGDGTPVIDLALTTNNKIKITAQDAQSLKYVLYTWNNGQETKVEANADNLKIIEQEIDIPLGQNTLKVQAVNQKEVSTTKELDVKGVKGPNVELVKQGDTALIRVSDDIIIERIEITLNGKNYKLDVASKNYTNLEYKQKLEQGENILIVKAYNKDGGVKEIKAKTVVQ